MKRDGGPAVGISDSAGSGASATESRTARAGSGLPRRRRLDASDAREAILEAAETLLTVSGPDSLRLTDIAAKAGVSHPNVLYHFGSIGELQRRLAQRVVSRLAKEIDNAFASDGFERLPIDRVISTMFAVFGAGGYARLLAWLAISQNEPSWDALETSLETLREALGAHPAMRGVDGEDRRRRAAQVIELTLASAIGYGLVGHTVERLFPPDPLRPTLARTLADMLGSAPAGGPMPSEGTGSRGGPMPSEGTRSRGGPMPSEG